MNVHHLEDILTYLEPLFTALVLFSLYRSQSVRKYFSLFAMLLVRLVSGLLCLGLLHSEVLGVAHKVAYPVYFFTYWSSYGVESVLSLLVIYSIFSLAMAPLKGLATLGILVFRWAGGISLAIALAVAVAPHASNRAFMVAMVTQLLQTSSVLTLCLLLFVCFAIRPLGLTYRSRIFGVSLGLGVMATTNLVISAWVITNSHLYSGLNIAGGVAACLTLLTWSAYFMLPEPKRRMILLPTTSPYLRWNQISEVLGDAPGFVAISGVPPEMFAPSEIEIMLRASALMTPKVAEKPREMLSYSA